MAYLVHGNVPFVPTRIHLDTDPFYDLHCCAPFLLLMDKNIFSSLEFEPAVAPT